MSRQSELLRLYKRRENLIIKLIMMNPSNAEWTRNLFKFEQVCEMIEQLEEMSDCQ